MNITFRDVEHQLCIVLDDKITTEFYCHVELANAVVCYGYVDKHAGLTYEILCTALYLDGDYCVVAKKDAITMKVRAETLKNAEIIPIKNNVIKKMFEDRIESIEDCYYNADGTEQSRKEISIDEFRHPYYPDDVKATLYKDGLKKETLWVRLQHYLGESNMMDGYIGVLLNTPFEPRYELSAGDKVLLTVMPIEKNKQCFIIPT